MSYQPTDLDDVPESLANRQFYWVAFTVVNGIVETRHQEPGKNVITPEGPVSLWQMTGKVSQKLYNIPGLLYGFAEAENDTIDIFVTGTLTINPAPRTIPDNNFVPVGKYIWRIKRKNDPATAAAPIFNVSPYFHTLTGLIPVKDAPVNTLAPVISGTAQAGQTLTVSEGAWDYNPETFTYEWEADGVTIDGATASALTLTTALVGKVITATVTAINEGGKASVTTTATAAVLSPPLNKPTVITLPAISGTPSVGEILTSTTGTWTFAPTSFTRQWRRDGAAITGATSATYTIVSGDLGKAISVSVTATNADGSGSATSDLIGPVTGVPVDGLDNTMPVPTMTLASAKGTFPPSFDIEIPVQAQADNIKFKIERYALSALNTVASTYTGTITDAQANANAVTGLFSGITAPSSYRMRLETLDGQRWGNWSNSVIHGDVDAPAITTASVSIKEGVKLALALTVSNEPAGVTWAISGTDAALFEITGTTVRILNDGVFDFELPTDGNKDNVYEITLSATDLAGNVGTKNVTVSITDADEIVDAFTFAKQSNATVNTDYTRTMTVSGLEAGYSVPISVSGGLRYSVNGGSTGTTAGTVKNGDVVTVTMKSSGTGAFTVSGTLNIGGVTGSFAVQTVIGSTPAIASASFFPTTQLQYTKEISLDFGVGTGFFFVSTNNAATNFKIDGVSVTSLLPTGYSYLFCFDSTTAGTKKLTFDLSGFWNASAAGITVANVSMDSPSVVATPNKYYNIPFNITAPVIPADGIGLVILLSSKKLSSTTARNNLIVDQLYNDPSATGTNYMVGTMAGAGNATFGSENGIYEAVTIGLAKKV